MRHHWQVRFIYIYIYLYEGSIVRTVWGQAAGAARCVQYANRVGPGYVVL